MIRVAIVEDDPSHGRAIARLLRASGMETLTFESAEAYLDRGDGPAADCLLVDVELTGMSGFELQRRLAATACAPPVVFLSAIDEPAEAVREKAGGCAFVRKTEPAESLLAAIRHALAGPVSSP